MLRLAALGLLLFAACGAQVAPPSSSPALAGALGTPLAADRIQILHTDDIHGRLEPEAIKSGPTTIQQGGMAALGGLVNALRGRGAERTLLVDGGDAWQGTFISNANQGQAVTQAMSRMAYDAMALGNHDFDWGQEVLAQRAKEATFPFLSANVVTAAGTVPTFAKPYVVKDLRIAKVAILGLTRVDTPGATKAGNTAGLRFEPLAQTVMKYLPELRSQADIVVVVDHSGADVDQQLAAAVPDIDVIVAAHDHMPLRTARLVGKTTIVDSGAYTQNLGHLELVWDAAAKKLSAANRSDEIIAVAAGRVAPDPEIAKLVDARRTEGEKYTSRVVGRNTQLLPQTRDEGALGNVVCDALLWYGREQGWQSDLAVYNMAGIREALPPGDITYGKLFQVLPFGDVILGVDMSGTQVRAIFETVAGGAGRICVSNAKFVYHFGGKDDHRLISASVAGAPIDPAHTYHVVVNDYLLGGGEGHEEFKAATNPRYGDADVDVVAAYMTTHSPVDPKVEGRVLSQ